MRFDGASSAKHSENASALLNGTSKAGSSSITGSAHRSASSTAPSVLPTSYMKPGSKWSKRMPSMLEVGGFCNILMRNNGSQAALRGGGAMLIPFIKSILSVTNYGTSARKENRCIAVAIRTDATGIVSS